MLPGLPGALPAAAPAPPAAAPSSSPSPPPGLDYARFEKTIPLVALRVDARDTDAAVRALRGTGCLVDLPRVKHVVAVVGVDGREDPRRRLLLLHQGIRALDLSDASPEQRSAVEGFVRSHFGGSSGGGAGAGVGSGAESGDGNAWAGGLQMHALVLGYAHWTVEEVLREVLPAALAGGEPPSGFETVGALAHVNLRDEYLPYKAVIGRVLLDKNPRLRCVVNKTAPIETVFRTFPMEVIAGDGDTRVSLRHSGASFRFDFAKVYWNTRLQTEHTAAVDALVPHGASVADVFAGVGPFAVPLALPSRGCTVWANDLNPESHAALRDNAARNRVGARVACFNEDGRAFIARVGAAGAAFVPTEMLMNLPADAIAFCDALEPASVTDPLTRPLPRVHVYCFSRHETEEGAADDAVRRLLAALRLESPCNAALERAAAAGLAAAPPVGRGAGLTNVTSPLVLALRGAGCKALLPDLLVRTVRNVAPGKLMFCLSFSLPRAVALADPVWHPPPAVASGSDEREPPPASGRGPLKRSRDDGAQ